jgi:hypothetical protein
MVLATGNGRRKGDAQRARRDDMDWSGDSPGGDGHPRISLADLMQLSILAYNPGNCLRRLTLPEVVKGWSLQSVPLRLIKTGAKLVRHARRLVFQVAEGAVPGDVWSAVLGRISGLRLVPG